MTADAQGCSPRSTGASISPGALENHLLEYSLFDLQGGASPVLEIVCGALWVALGHTSPLWRYYGILESIMTL